MEFALISRTASCASKVCTPVAVVRRPVKKLLRDGAQYGAWAKAMVNRQPESDTMESRALEATSWRKSCETA